MYILELWLRKYHISIMRDLLKPLILNLNLAGFINLRIDK